MITSDVNIELQIPNPKEGEKEEGEELLARQTEHLVKFWRAVLGGYKKDYDFTVPSLAVKLPSKFKKKALEAPSKAFARVLVDHHLKRVPTAHTGKQYSVVYRMYEAGFTNTEELIVLYDKLAAKWADTSWFTVFFHLKQPKVKSADADTLEFNRKELDEKQVEDLKDRLTSYKGGN